MLIRLIPVLFVMVGTVTAYCTTVCCVSASEDVSRGVFCWRAVMMMLTYARPEL